MLDQFRLDDRVALITGGGKGIGAATAEAFADAGADVVVTARTAADVEEVAAAVRSRGRRALAVPGDVNDLEFLASLVDRTVDELGGLDVLVNNAGGSVSKPLLDTTVDALKHSFHFNIASPFELVRLTVPHMLERGGGSIVNISSVAGLRASKVAGAAYVMSKFGVNGLTESINIEERANGIRACVICPGEVNTPILDLRPSPPPPEARERLIQPEDVAQCVLLALTLPPRAVIEQLVIMPQ